MWHAEGGRTPHQCASGYANGLPMASSTVPCAHVSQDTLEAWKPLLGIGLYQEVIDDPHGTRGPPGCGQLVSSLTCPPLLTEWHGAEHSAIDIILSATSVRGARASHSTP